MTLDEALELAVLGYRVRHDGLQQNAYIHYDFNGWRIQFVHDGRKGSSSGWDWNEDDKKADWYTVGEEKVEAWPDFVQTNWNIKQGINKVDPEEIGAG